MDGSNVENALVKAAEISCTHWNQSIPLPSQDDEQERLQPAQRN